MSIGPLRLRELLQRLVEAEISFILVGGLAVNAWGYDGLAVRVCSLEHLLQMKRASDRPRDHDDIESLEAAQEPGGERS